VLLALGATFVAQGPNGRREIDAQDFSSVLRGGAEVDELLVESECRDAGRSLGIEKLTKRAQTGRSSVLCGSFAKRRRVG